METTFASASGLLRALLIEKMNSLLRNASLELKEPLRLEDDEMSVSVLPASDPNASACIFLSTGIAGDRTLGGVGWKMVDPTSGEAIDQGTVRVNGVIIPPAGIDRVELQLLDRADSKVRPVSLASLGLGPPVNFKEYLGAAADGGRSKDAIPTPSSTQVDITLDRKSKKVHFLAGSNFHCPFNVIAFVLIQNGTILACQLHPTTVRDGRYEETIQFINVTLTPDPSEVRPFVDASDLQQLGVADQLRRIRDEYEHWPDSILSKWKELQALLDM